MEDKKVSSRTHKSWGFVRIKRADMKPCPFCGSEVQVRSRVINDKDLYFFLCPNEECGATVSFDNAEVNAYSRRRSRYHKEEVLDQEYAPAFEYFCKRAGDTC